MFALMILGSMLAACGGPSATELKEACRAKCENVNTCSTGVQSDCDAECTDESAQAAADSDCASETLDVLDCQASADACTAENSDGPCSAEAAAALSCVFGGAF
jgi:hypothetical protein